MESIEESDAIIEFGRFRLRPRRRDLSLDGAPVEIGSRALDVLIALVEARGGLVTKERLIADVWAGIVVEENNLQVQISTLRKTLGDDRDYIRTVAGRGYRFSAELRVLSASEIAVPPVSSASPAGNLPVPVSDLVGREAERGRLLPLARANRVLTLTGAGGIGKTRLGLAIARDLLPEFPDGVWLAELAPLADPGQVAAAIAVALRFEMLASMRPERIKAVLGGKRLLLVLDNCEHVVGAVAQIVEALLCAAPGLRVLATSREPLGIEGEHVYQLQPLELPPESAPAREMLPGGAMQLFLARARAADPRLALDERTVAAAATICRRLDGIPLALEIAAARIPALGIETLASRLDHRFALLVAGRRTALPRHHTLQATLDWSYGLLTPAEQVALRRLSVFAGGWSIASAAAVAGEPAPGASTVDTITSLVDKSLVIADLAGAEPRYRMLETTRQYAAARLRDSGEADLRPALARWLVRHYTRSMADWQLTGEESWLRRYGRDVENLRAALDWAFGPEGDPDLALELVSCSDSAWAILSLPEEHHRWFSLATARMTPSTPPIVAARLWLGRCDWSDIGDRRVLAPALRAAEQFRLAEDRMGLGTALWRAAYAVMAPGNAAEADGYLAEAGAVLRPLGDSKSLLRWLRLLALSRRYGGDFPSARRLLEEAVELARRIGSQRHLSQSLGSLAELHFARGGLDEAIETAELALDHYGESRDRVASAIEITGSLASYYLARRDPARARELALRSLGAARARIIRRAYGWNIERLALVAAESGDDERAARLLGYAEAANPAHREMTEQLVHDRLRARLGRDLAAERLRALRSEGAAWSEEKAVAEALQV